MYLIQNLPDEILESILYHVSPYEDIKSCSLVSWRWYHCCRRVVHKRKQLFKTALLSGPMSFYYSVETPVVSPSTSFTSSRDSHSACVHGSTMFVFGGCTSTYTTFNDLWKIDLTTRKKLRVVTTGNYPTPKAHATMIVWKDSLVLFGGWTSPYVYPLHQQGVVFDELHIYNITLNTWTQLYYPGAPAAVAGHSATLHGDVVVFFGGLQKRRDTSASTNDILCLDLANTCWFKPAVSDTAPTPRYGHIQIKIDERHVLVMAGCGGSNNLHTDFWLLTIPLDMMGGMWIWKPLAVEGIEFMPKQIWCNPACKVQDHVIVLSRKNEQESKGNSMTQLLFRPIRAVNSHISVPPDAGNQHLPERVLNQDHVKNRSHNLLPSHEDNPNDRLQTESSNHGPIHHPKPSVRPNASSNRERRLLMLSMHGDRIRAKALEQSSISAVKSTSGGASTFVMKLEQKPACHMAVYLMDISSAVSENVLRWMVGPQWRSAAPHPRLLCSLVVGLGELILCGGKIAGDCGCSGSLPPLLYITAPPIYQ